MNPNQYLTKFFAESEHLVDGHGTRHAISTTRTGQLEMLLGTAIGVGQVRSRSTTIRSMRHKLCPGPRHIWPTKSDCVRALTVSALIADDRIALSPSAAFGDDPEKTTHQEPLGRAVEGLGRLGYYWNPLAILHSKCGRLLGDALSQGSDPLFRSQSTGGFDIGCGKPGSRIASDSPI